MPGRCAGCGEVDTSCKRVAQHVVHCPQYLKLWKSDPDKALDPKAEYARWRAEDMSTEAKDRRKQERLADRFAELDRARGRQAKRWETPPDPLED